MKKILFVGLFLVNLINAHCQLKHTKGIDGVGIAGIYTWYGVGGSLNYTRYLNTKLYIGSSLELTSENIVLSKVITGQLLPEAGYTILKIGNNYFLDLKVNLMLGYEKITNPIFTRKNRFIVGESIGFKNEYFLSSKIKLDLDVCQRFWQIGRKESNLVLTLGIFYNL
jgi:hypothetical protein